MQRSVVLFLGLFLALASANNFRELSTRPLLSFAAPKNGEINLTATETGHFVAYVDLNRSTSGDEVISTVPMTPVFYKSYSLLSTDCLNFTEYKWDKYNCTVSKTEVTVDYLNFRAEGFEATSEIFLDYTNWVLHEDAKIILANKCSTKPKTQIGAGSSGLLGMGTSDENDKNFIGNKDFSIYLDKAGKTGKLFFDFKKELGAPNPLVTLEADRNWQVVNVDGIAVGTKTSTFDNTSMIIDINTELIGLPRAIYNQVIDLLNSGYNATCDLEKTYMPVCTVNRAIKSLPTITLYSGKDKKIPLPPQLYVAANGSNDSVVLEKVTLNIHYISETNEGESYVQADYNNHIVLGSSFVRHYYLKFDVANNTIAIYERGQGDTSSGSGWVFILIGLAVVVIGAVVFMKMRGNKASGGLANNESNYGSMHN